MKLLIRIMSLSIIGILFISMLMHMMMVNVREDEMNTITSLAMSQTQTIMQEQIEDDVYGTSNARMRFNNTQEYFAYYKDSFEPLINTRSEYVINLLEADIRRGLLSVEVECKFKQLNGQDRVLKTRKTSVVDVILDNTTEGN